MVKIAFNRNNFANEDFVQKMNFLNKHNELEFCLKSLKELVILKTILFQEGRQLSDFKNHFLFGVRQFMGSDISLSGSRFGLVTENLGRHTKNKKYHFLGKRGLPHIYN